MHLDEQYLQSFYRDVGANPVSVASAKHHVSAYMKRNKRLQGTQEVMVAIANYYRHLFAIDAKSEYLKLAKSYYEAALKVKNLSKDYNYNNQIHAELGKIYFDEYSDTRDEIKARLAVFHFQAIIFRNLPDPYELEIYRTSLENISALYRQSPPPYNDREFKSSKTLVRNDINILVAELDLHIHGYQTPDRTLFLSHYVDLNQLAEGRLSFHDNMLDLRQAYKIARLCKDRDLIKDRNYLDILWRIENAVQHQEDEEYSHLRKKTRYQLFLTLFDLYKIGDVSLDGFNTLYQRLMEKKGLFNLALLRGDQKALNVKRTMDQIFDKGVVPAYVQRNIYTPLTSPGTYFINVFSKVAAVTKPLAKWPLYILGSILDVVLIVPLIFKLITPICKMIFCCVSPNSREADINWGGSWFTGLLGTVIGEWLIGYGGGAIIAGGIALATYPFKLGYELCRRIGEFAHRPRHRAERSVPLQDNLDVEVLRVALYEGIDVERKPAAGFISDKTFSRYATTQSYTMIYQFINPSLQDGRGMQAASAPLQREVEELEYPRGAPLFPRFNNEAQIDNPYLVPPAYN